MGDSGRSSREGAVHAGRAELSIGKNGLKMLLGLTQAVHVVSCRWMGKRVLIGTGRYFGKLVASCDALQYFLALHGQKRASSVNFLIRPSHVPIQFARPVKLPGTGMATAEAG